jgi:hypothetical protein
LETSARSEPGSPLGDLGIAGFFLTAAHQHAVGHPLQLSVSGLSVMLKDVERPDVRRCTAYRS